MRSRSFPVWPAIVPVFLLALSDPAAAEITGTVREVSGDTASVEPQGGTPASGDGVEIFFQLAGVDEEVSVASGTVIGAEGGRVKVKIEKATGEVTKDQLARFTPGKGGRAIPESSAPPEPRAAPPLVPSGGGYIGVQLTETPEGTGGVRVFSVEPQGPAAVAGVEPNDLIVAVDSVPVEKAGQLADVTAKLAPGTRHAFLVSRAGKLQKLELSIGERPANFSSVPAIVQAPTQFAPPAPAAKSGAVSSGAGGEAAAAPYVSQGIAQFSGGNIDGAIASYSEGIRVAPSIGLLYLNRANAYLYKPNFQAAIDDVNKALKLGLAKTDDAFVIRGTAKAGLGQYESAIIDCNRALKINPQSALAYNNRANNQLRRGSYKSALGDCSKSIGIDPNSALPYYNRGFAYVNLGNLPAALSDWKKAVSLQSSFGAELNPKIAQLEAQGVSGKQASAPSASGSAGWTDLTNAPQKLIGTWQGGRHRKQYFADGTMVTDPHLVPDPPRVSWRLEGDRLTEYYSGSNITLRIVSIDNRELVTADEQGHTYRAQRIPDAQARKEKANW